jgi:hypothetical protein
MLNPNVQSLELGVNKVRNYDKLHIKQYDKNLREFRFMFIEDNDMITIPEGYIAKFQATKPDGTIVFDDCTIENNNTVVFKPKESLSSSKVTGTIKAEIGFYKSGMTSEDDGLIQPVSFDIILDPSAMNRDGIISSNDFNTLTIMINTLTGSITTFNEKIIEVNEAIANSIEATQDAIGATELANEKNIEFTDSENERRANDAVRPIWHYVTQAQYDALPQTDKDNILNFYRITDNQDSNLIATLTDLLLQITTALSAVESSTVDINNINDLIITEIQTWSSSKITNRIRKFDYTASSTVTSITHGLNYTPTTDDLLVFYNGVLLEENINYTNSADFHTINLSSWTIPSGGKVYFKLIKYIK